MLDVFPEFNLSGTYAEDDRTITAGAFGGIASGSFVVCLFILLVFLASKL